MFFFQECGIPKHFGLYYAMGTALMMEGLLSACYHVCPNYTNFQFGKATLILNVHPVYPVLPSVTQCYAAYIRFSPGETLAVAL